MSEPTKAAVTEMLDSEKIEYLSHAAVSTGFTPSPELFARVCDAALTARAALSEAERERDERGLRIRAEVGRARKAEAALSEAQRALSETIEALDALIDEIETARTLGVSNPVYGAEDRARALLVSLEVKEAQGE